MVVFFVRNYVFEHFYGNIFPSRKHIFIMSLVVGCLTTLVSSVYPQVGSIAGYTGAICGMYFIYLLPVFLRIRF